MSLRWRKFGGMLAGAAPLAGAIVSLGWLALSSEANPTSMFIAMAQHPIGAIALIQTVYTALLGVLWLRYRPFRAPEGAEWPKVSVIIPAYNEGPMVRVSLLSALRNDYPADKLEILAVDDGSDRKSTRLNSSH